VLSYNQPIKRPTSVLNHTFFIKKNTCLVLRAKIKKGKKSNPLDDSERNKGGRREITLCISSKFNIRGNVQRRLSTRQSAVNKNQPIRRYLSQQFPAPLLNRKYHHLLHSHFLLKTPRQALEQVRFAHLRPPLS
jgi:hypothetical protein